MSVDSMSKILEYVSKVARQPIFVDGERYPTPVVEKVVLQESFFYKDDCMMCGKCCPNETTVFTSEGWGRIHSATKEDFLKWGLDPIAREELLMRCTPQVIDINGSSIVYWVSDKDHVKTPIGCPGRTERRGKDVTGYSKRKELIVVEFILFGQ